jgi:multiple sugar transport system substrate-binding protein
VGFIFRNAHQRRRGTPRSRRLRFGIALAALALVTAAGCGNAQSSSGPVTLNWYIFPEFSGAFVKSAASCSKASNGAYTVKIQTLPNAADGQRQQMVRRLAADDSSLDILGLDVTRCRSSRAWWPRLAAEAQRSRRAR